ncbi:MAG: DNA topoisomerase IB, partial [Chloroflexi bacterium]
FEYVDDNGQLSTVESADVNEYLRQVSGSGFTAKDFRTWAGTVFAMDALKGLGEAENQTKAKKNIGQAIEIAAEHLGNTKTICRKCYVHPAV